MPIFFSFPTKFLYFFMQLGLFESLVGEYLVFAMSPMLAVVDPCVTLYYVLPYRHFIMGKLRIGNKRKNFSNVAVIAATQNQFAVSDVNGSV
ncbi:hypothetical protein COOONC_14180 [Cooperia oncophora]